MFQKYKCPSRVFTFILWNTIKTLRMISLLWMTFVQFSNEEFNKQFTYQWLISTCRWLLSLCTLRLWSGTREEESVKEHKFHVQMFSALQWQTFMYRVSSLIDVPYASSQSHKPIVCFCFAIYSQNVWAFLNTCHIR